jgi:hypothetical protein
MAAEAARLGKVRTKPKLFLTLTGFLMEGVYTQYKRRLLTQLGTNGAKEEPRV